MRHCRLGQVKHGVDVDFERQLPFLIRYFFDPIEACLMCCVVHKYVELAKFAYSRVHNGTTVSRRRDVPGNQHSLPSGLLNEPLGLKRISLFVEIGYHNICTLSSVGDGYSSADATVTAGNDSHFSFKPTRASV